MAASPDTETDRSAPNIPSPGPATASSSASELGWWSTLISTFLAIFVAEVGDKTQVAVLLLAAQSGSSVSVFLGAATALIATSLVGVLLGRWLAQRLSTENLETIAGAILIFVAIWLLWDAVVGG